ncbi:DUF2294 domain-containing protein [Candidatus Aerophobetes bacterium]|nr:DUF2294 domain-containing protein [Candidatus Aerophobetes bacterium]
MKKKTKGQLEAEISEALVKFEKEYMGRGPVETKTYIIEDTILVRLKGVLTPAERHLSSNSDGAMLVKQVRAQLLEKARGLLEEVIEKLTAAKVISMHSDISTKTGERIIIFILDDNLEARFTSNNRSLLRKYGK